MSSRTRPHEEITRAVRRLSTEPLIPLSDVAYTPLELDGEVYRPSADALRRWGQEGRIALATGRRVYLDIVYVRRLAAWVTSLAAVERFRSACPAPVSVS